MTSEGFEHAGADLRRGHRCRNGRPQPRGGLPDGRLGLRLGLPPIRLAAIADANLALAEDGARRYGYEKALPSWQAVAEDPSIDAVSIVVGNALHRPIAEALVDAGKHVLCEKPLAGSMEDARAMVELEKRQGSHRVGTATDAPRDRGDPRPHPEHELGELTTLHARYWCDYACDPRGPLKLAVQGRHGLRGAR